MELTVEGIALLLAIGSVAGVAAGFVGIGGGLIMVPVLMTFFRFKGVEPALAILAAQGTSQVVATFSSGSSSWRHHRQGNVIWRLVPLLAPSSFLASWAASSVANLVPATGLRLILAAALLAAALRMLLERPRAELPGQMRDLHWALWVLIGAGVGVFAGFTGLAGGVMLVPAMAFFARVPTRCLAGTSSSTVMFTAAAAVLGKMLATPPVELGWGFVGYSNLGVAAALAVTSIPGAQLGAWLNKRAGSVWYRRIFGLLLLVVVVRLLLALG